MKPVDSISLRCLLVPKKSWQTLKIGRALFQAHFQDGRHRPYWKVKFWSIDHTIKCNRSFLTILMVTNPFSILFLQFEVYFTLYSNTGYFEGTDNWLCLEQLRYVNDLVEISPHQLLFLIKSTRDTHLKIENMKLSYHMERIFSYAVNCPFFHRPLCRVSIVYIATIQWPLLVKNTHFSISSICNGWRLQFVWWSHVTLRLDAFFGIKGIEQGERERPWLVYRTVTFDDTLLDKYNKRQVEWASRVQYILSFFSELHSADAVYHRCCTSYGRTSEWFIWAVVFN